MKKLIVLALLAMLAFASCMSTISTTDGRLSYADVKGEEKGEFAASASYMYIIHPSVFTLGEKKTEQLDVVMGPALEGKGANAATKLTIHDGFTAKDYLLTAFVPILSWGTIEVTGTALKQ